MQFVTYNAILIYLLQMINDTMYNCISMNVYGIFPSEKKQTCVFRIQINCILTTNTYNGKVILYQVL